MSTRRQFVSAALVGLSAKGERRIEGGFVHETQRAGHALRDGKLSANPMRQQRIAVAIVGGGMAGLCAAWQLERKGFRDFVLLEMDEVAGGNARWGENEVGRYPWAAHYLPVPNRESTLVRELLTEFGVMKEGEVEERFLCFSPQERLFLHGRWQESLEPDLGLTKRDRQQFKQFGERMQELRATGQFRVPVLVGAPRDTALDRLTMSVWMRQQGWDSEYLHWYVDYSTRDDYGTAHNQTSAWAGVHYFAGREHEEKGPITWPEGNGWLLQRLLAKLQGFVRTGSPVVRVTRAGQRWRVVTPSVEWLAEAVIWAAPSFVAPHVVEGVAQPEGLTYAPWLSANLTLDRMPREAPGAEMAWDNVIYRSPGLGYVLANHMSLASRRDQAVLTYYWALAQGDPSAERRRLLATDWAEWTRLILQDLAPAHPDLAGCVRRIDIMRHGHAMARPVPGFLNASWRRWAVRTDHLYFANSDLSGFSIFEEAQYRGVSAAERALAAVSRH